MTPASPPDDPNPASLLHYARTVPSRGLDDDTREVMGCLLAWLVLVSGLFTGMAWVYWSAIHAF